MSGYFGQDGQGGPLGGGNILTAEQEEGKGGGVRTSLSDSMGKPQPLMLLGLTYSISELAVISCKKKPQFEHVC